MNRDYEAEMKVKKKIGVDLRVLQIGHQYRGIGAHIINLLNYLNRLKEAQAVTFVFYINKDQPNPLDELDIDVSSLDYSVSSVSRPAPGGSRKRKLYKVFIKLRDLILKGDIGLNGLKDLDVFLQSDFKLGVPSRRLVKTALVVYDLIPWVMSEHYLPSYSQHRNSGASIKNSVMGLLNKKIYIWMMKSSTKRAKKLIAISEYTRRDFIKILNVKPPKIETVLLSGDFGPVDPALLKIPDSLSGLSYDFFGEPEKAKVDLKKERYIFWLGGADRRRRLEDLVDAFNSLNAGGENIKLLLSGFDFRSIDSLVTDDISRAAIHSSSFRKNIVFVGFISAEEKVAMYRNAIACVLPSMYEGFGMTVLESMRYSCPVITYKNSSISEVGGNAAIYADGHKGIEDSILRLLKDQSFRDDVIKRGDNQLGKFDWSKTAKKTFKVLVDL